MECEVSFIANLIKNFQNKIIKNLKMDFFENNVPNQDVPTFQRSLKVHRDTISQILFTPNK